MVNSGRQIGGVFGTAILVLTLGKGATTGDPTQYYHLWWVAAATCAAAAVTSLGLTPHRQTEEEPGTVASSLRGSPRAVRRTVAGRLPPAAGHSSSRPPNARGVTPRDSEPLHASSPSTISEP